MYVFGFVCSGFSLDWLDLFDFTSLKVYVGIRARNGLQFTVSHSKRKEDSSELKFCKSKKYFLFRNITAVDTDSI